MIYILKRERALFKTNMCNVHEMALECTFKAQLAMQLQFVQTGSDKRPKDEIKKTKVIWSSHTHKSKNQGQRLWQNKFKLFSHFGIENIHDYDR